MTDLARTVGGPISGSPSPGTPVNVNVTGPLSSFSELSSITPIPTSQGSFVFGLNDELFTTITYGTGAGASVAGGILSVSSGTQATGYCLVRATNTNVYRPGQGSLTRLTALFASPVTNHQQIAGIGNPESGYYFGYNGGADFGILHVSSGTRAVQSLTITTKSSTAENVTVTLDGTAVSVPVTNGASTVTTAWEIAQGNFSQAGQGWDAQAIDSIVYFVARQCNAAVGTVSVAGTTVVGVGAVVTAAIANTSTFIPQSSWNGTALTTALNPQKFNVFFIGFQYLGAGDAFFYIEENTTGRPVLVHTIRNANTRTTPVLRQPSCNVLWSSRNLGNVVSTDLKGLSCATFLEGSDTHVGSHYSASSQKAVSAGVLTPIVSVEVMRNYKSRASNGTMTLTHMSVAANGTKPTTFYLYRNATLGGSPNFAAVNTNSMCAAESSSSSISGGTQLFSVNVNKDGNDTIPMLELDLNLNVGQIFTIAALSTGNFDAAASLEWQEE